MTRSVLGLAAGCLALAIVSGVSGHVLAVSPAASTRLGEVAPATALGPGPEQQSSPAVASAAEQRAVLDRYCLTCHNQNRKVAGLALDTLDLARVGHDAEVWEGVVRKLRGGIMPPAGTPRPDRATYDGLRTWLESELDRAAASNPNPGRPAAFHRLNRTEYGNAIRDLLALEVDVDAWLPGDPSSYGFDNIGDALGVSSGLLERYLSVATRISRLAVGDASAGGDLATYVIPSDLTQRDRLEGLPFGTRGGALIRHHFPLDGEYGIQLRLGRNYNTRIVGLNEPQQIEVTVDGQRVQLFTIGGGSRVESPYGAPGEPDDQLKFRLPVKAGPRVIGAAFLKRPSAQFEDLRQPAPRDRVEFGDTQGQPLLSRVEIDGPNGATGTSDTPSRQRIFVCRPTDTADAACARTILSTLARRAYRRPVTETDLRVLISLFDEGREEGGFEKGIEKALTRILVSPAFLFRIEEDPAGAAPGTASRVSDLELASRLSFFLWSSIPDDELLEVAESGKLTDSATFDQQVRRMLADSRSDALVSSFAGQWLQLRNVPELKPDRWMFPEFDENLRRAFRRETELFIESILGEDRSVLDLLRADYTFLNERLARHYGIPQVYGDHFRRVTLDDDTRGGLLGHGSILTLTSSPNRTSPVRRGVYILENILGVTPPPPPPDVPALEGKPSGKVLSMRDRMEVHRANPVCASCHAIMDPLGLPLENFDGIGRWRTISEANTPIDASGALPDGTAFEGPAGLKRALLDRSGEFVTTMTEKLLTYAVGRGLEPSDLPAVRGIVREAAAHDYRFSALILGVVESDAFQMRRSSDSPVTAAVAPLR